MALRRRFGPLIGSVDESTNRVRFLIFAAETGEMLTYHQIEMKSLEPKKGWIEQNPIEILNAVQKCIEVTLENLRHLDIDPQDIHAIGITNQRETVIVWDKYTGKPLYNAILWSDVRNANLVKHYLTKTKRNNADFIKSACGLPISTYFSALKLRWLIDNIPEVKKAISEGRCLFGNVDSWLIWNLTGGRSDGVHVTDVTNASRTMLMNLESLQWDPMLLRFFDVPKEILPKIRSSSEIYGYFLEGTLRGVPLSGCLGDQQAALVGQMCLEKGQIKNTYGTGCFLLYNTGKTRIYSDNGLLTTVAYQFGSKSSPRYALEGSIGIAAATLSWLKKSFNAFSKISAVDELINSSTNSSNDLYFVPSFCGLYAPYWCVDSRSVLFGLNEYTKKSDILKAFLEAICYQTRDVLEALSRDCGETCVSKLLVDGSFTCSNYIVQLLADIIGIPVERVTMTETTALGAAIAAGCAEGVSVWNFNKVRPSPNDTFRPLISEQERNVKYYKWKMAVEKSLDWESDSQVKRSNGIDPNERRILSMLPGSIFLVSSFGMLLLAEYFNCR